LTFLKSLLGGAMSDVTAAAGKRLFRLGRRLGASPGQVEELSPGECVAMSWLSEMLALCEAAGRFPTRVLWIDFDAFLQEPGAGLAAALRHFGARGAEEAARDILGGPTMGRYAKAPAHPFDANVRERLLRQSEAAHGPEIRKGLDWLERLAASLPAVMRVLDASASAGQWRSHTKS